MQELPPGVKALLSPGYLDYIVVPINHPGHWVCAVLDLKNHAIIYLDSLGASATACACMHACVACEPRHLVVHAPALPLRCTPQSCAPAASDTEPVRSRGCCRAPPSPALTWPLACVGARVYLACRAATSWCSSTCCAGSATRPWTSSARCGS